MTELEWQSLFLLAAAFFVGAVVACGLKRRFYYRTGAATGANDTAQPVQAAAAPNTEQPKVEVSEPPAPGPQAAPSSANFIPVAQPKVEPIVAPEPASFVPVAQPKAEPTAAEPAPPPVAPSPAPVATAAQPAPSPEPAPPVADPAPPSARAAAPAAESEPTPLRPVAERADVSGLRSVRSQALRGAGESVAATKDPDDLKRIRGVGVLIERKLNSLGVSTYEQIANWTGADIVRISQILDFKGRIERENWIEQARILSTGGQTEFSRRFNRADT